MKFEFYQDKKKEWRWRLVARNGKTVADSGEGYEKIGACKRAVASIMKRIPTAKVVEPERIGSK